MEEENTLPTPQPNPDLEPYYCTKCNKVFAEWEDWLVLCGECSLNHLAKCEELFEQIAQQTELDIIDTERCLGWRPVCTKEEWEELAKDSQKLDEICEKLQQQYKDQHDQSHDL